MLKLNGNIPSSKNSNRWTGRFLIKSKVCMRYIKESKLEYQVLRDSFIKQFNPVEGKPTRVGMFFIRDSRRRFDYINACQIVADLMVKNDWLVDDNADYFVPVFLGYKVDKTCPGVILTVVEETVITK